ncbi:MAG: YbaK/EbsC family protein [Rhodospirillales bacterium]|nr:YbaK/EbsC family protein [Rhodospirillales bacterium]
MSNLKKASVKKVRKALADAGLNDTVIELDETARTAEDAAKSTGAELGAIVKSLVFVIGEQPVMALVAGDHVCKAENLPRALNLEGEVSKASADDVKAATGFTIGGCAPIAHKMDLPMVIDVSLKRFETLYAAAGHAHCVFPTTVAELKRLTGGIISYNIAEPISEG